MQNKYNQLIYNSKIKNRQSTISKLETGDLIKVVAETLPIIYHYGIVEKTENEIFVYHNDPYKINSNGGNLIKDTIKKFVNNRDIISVEKTNIKTENIHELYEALKTYKYDFINFNCEHFINFAKGNKYFSSQVVRWTSVALISMLVYYLIRNKKI